MNGRSGQRPVAWGLLPDFRIICDCQRHARSRFWKRTISLAARAVAVLVSIPLAFALFDLPTSAMNLNLAGMREGSPFRVQKQEPATVAPLNASEEAFFSAASLPIFTTPAMREQFLSGRRADGMSIEVFREEYFRRNIPYGSIIHREARRNNLAPELVAAIVHTESDFRPHLVSNKSAQGLMQIIPSTARILGLNDPFDPEKNIAAGTRYYRYLLNRFDDHTLALAAYNAGEGNVQKYRGIPPFRETQQYVTKVRGHMQRYRQRVNNGYTSSLGITYEEP